MPESTPQAHPYIPNAEPAVLKEMLDALGMQSADDIYREIPAELRFDREMDLPPAIMSEQKLRRHMRELLALNTSVEDYTSYLGGGCWERYTPEVCTTIMGRDEFLTSYVGDAYSDHGKFQALFETSSMIGDLTGFEAVGTPNYDWGNAAAIACRMAIRTTGRHTIVVAENVSKMRESIICNYVKPENEIRTVGFDITNGALDMAALEGALDETVAAVYFENPTYLGTLEAQAGQICEAAHKVGALVIMGVDPTSLGVLEAPAALGADYAVGDYQPCGLPMSYAGTVAGFVATKDEKEFLGEYPSLLFGICKTSKEGELGFGEVFYERTSYASREKGKDFIGTTTALYGIVAGVYMALMGPQGFKELGEGTMQRVAYAKQILANIPGIKLAFNGLSYCDFTINFDATSKSVADINASLLEHKIFGGRDLSRDFPQLGQSALYAVTEMRDKDDLDQLAAALTAVCA